MEDALLSGSGHLFGRSRILGAFSCAHYKLSEMDSCRNLFVRRSLTSRFDEDRVKMSIISVSTSDSLWLADFGEEEEDETLTCLSPGLLGEGGSEDTRLKALCRADRGSLPDD